MTLALGFKLNSYLMVEFISLIKISSSTCWKVGGTTTWSVDSFIPLKDPDLILDTKFD